MNPFLRSCETRHYRCSADGRLYLCGVPAVVGSGGFECPLGTLGSLWVPAGRWLCVPLEWLLPVQVTDEEFKRDFEAV